MRFLSFSLICLFCTSCLPFNYKPVIQCTGKLNATETQLHQALDRFPELYRNNLIDFETVQKIALSDTSFFRKYYGFKVSDRMESIYKINLIKAYFKNNIIPPAISKKPRYNYTVLSDDNQMVFRFSVSNCLADMYNGYDLPEQNICKICLEAAGFKRADSNKFKSGRSFELTHKERKQAKIVFENDILSKLKSIIEKNS